MNNKTTRIKSLTILGAFFISAILFSLPVYALDISQGHFAREGNDESPSATSKNNIYIKFFDERWVAMMYVPYPYASAVPAATITRVMRLAKNQTTGSAYLRGKFGELKELATVQIERFGYLGNQLVFECGALSPCTINLHDEYLELVKPGVITEHIIKYNHVVE